MLSILASLLFSQTLLFASVSGEDKVFDQEHIPHLSLYIYSAPRPLEWSRPGRLVRSAVNNILNGKVSDKSLQEGPIDINQLESFEIYEQITDFIREDRDNDDKLALVTKTHPHAISHINVKVSCPGRSQIFIGTTSSKSDGSYLNDLLFRGGSLETIVKNVDGRFYTKEEIEDWLPILSEKGHVHKLTYLLNEHNCERLIEFTRQYQAFGFDRIYGGLASHPLRGEGAGCSAFGMAYLKVLNLYQEEFDQLWKRTKRIPLKYMTINGKRAKRTFWSFAIWRYNGRWATEKEEHFKIDFWDPELMHEWMVRLSLGSHELPFSYPSHLTLPTSPSSRLIELTVDARKHPNVHGDFWQF